MGIGYSQKTVSEWTEFIDGLRIQNRYHPVNEPYVAGLIRGSLERRVFIPSGTSIFRSRIMPLDQALIETPLGSEEMGPPPSRAATGGRLNPEGISCLYAALEEDTAIAEVRPWTAARLTIAEFKTREDLEVLDLRPHIVRQSSVMDERQLFLSDMVSRPVHREDRWGYLGTQYLAEALKAKGVMGILYNSALRANGQNVAIFSSLTVDVTATRLVEIRGVSYSYGPAGGSRSR